MYKTLQQSPRETDSKPENKTGIPTQLKQQMEQFSGLSLDSVRVHYSSSKPAQLQAYAYTQGNEVYIAPGQERHLQHELGHVIQQRQRQIPPTVYRNGAAINLDPALEREADSYGKLNLGRLSGNSHIENKSPSGQPAIQLSPHAKFWKYFYVGGVELSKMQREFLVHWNDKSEWEIPPEARELKEMAARIDNDGDKPSSSTQPSSATPSSSSVPLRSSSSSTSEAPPSSATPESTLAPAEAPAASSRPVAYNLPLMVYETFGGDSSKLLHIFNQTLQYPGLSICVIGINRKIINTSNSEPDIKALAVDVDYLRKNIATRISSRHMAILAPFIWKSAADHYYDFPYYEVRSRLMEIADQETDGIKQVLYRWIDGDAQNDTTRMLDTKLLASLAAASKPMLLSGVYNWRLDAAMLPEVKASAKINNFTKFIPMIAGLLIINRLESHLRQRIFVDIERRERRMRSPYLAVKGRGSGDYYLPESILMMNRKAHSQGIENLHSPERIRKGWRPGMEQDMESSVGFPIGEFLTVIDARLSVTKPNKIDSMGRQYVPLRGNGTLGVPFSRVRQTALDTGHFRAVAGITPSSAFGPGTMALLVRDMIKAGKEELIMRLMEMAAPCTLDNPDELKGIYDEIAAEAISVERIEEAFGSDISKIKDMDSESALQPFVDDFVYNFLMKVLMPLLIDVMIRTVRHALLKPSPRAAMSPVQYAPPGLFKPTDPAGLLFRDIARSSASSRAAAAFWNDDDL